MLTIFLDCQIFLINIGTSEMVVIRLRRLGAKKRPFYAMDDPEDSRYTLSYDMLLYGLEVTTGGQRNHACEYKPQPIIKESTEEKVYNPETGSYV